MPRSSHNQAELIRLAITGIDAQIRELQETRARLTQSSTGGAKPARRGASKSASAGATTAPKRVFSAATRKRLSLAAKRRWARIRNEKKGK